MTIAALPVGTQRNRRLRYYPGSFFHPPKENQMTIKVGDPLPDGKLSESIEFDAACPPRMST